MDLGAYSTNFGEELPFIGQISKTATLLFISLVLIPEPLVNVLGFMCSKILKGMQCLLRPLWQ